MERSVAHDVYLNDACRQGYSCSARTPALLDNMRGIEIQEEALARSAQLPCREICAR